jgi:hypothetical protein
MTAATAHNEDPTGPPWRSRTAAVLVACAVALGACGGDDDKADERPFRPATVPSAATTTVPAGSVATPAGTTRKATIRDARKAVDADRYAEAEKTFSALTSAERTAVRTRIANRLARRARAAVRAGNRGLVDSLLAQVRRYPATRLTRSVRAEYRTAVAKADKRDRDRLLLRQRQARERRQRARAERAAEQAREAQQQKQP